MLRESSKAWSNGSEAYSSDPDEEEEEDMVFGEPDQDGVAEEMMDLSDLPTALFACNVHEAAFEDDVHRVGSRGMGAVGALEGSRCCLMSFSSCAVKFAIASRNESPMRSSKCMSSSVMGPDMHVPVLPLFFSLRRYLLTVQAFCHGWNVWGCRIVFSRKIVSETAIFTTLHHFQLKVLPSYTFTFIPFMYVERLNAACTPNPFK